jgi:hypothetical protein
MKRLLALVLLLALSTSAFAAAAAAPLRVFIRSGPKTHGPGAHDHPRFLAEWAPLLNARGAVASGGNTFPTAEQLAETDVLVLHSPNAGDIAAAYGGEIRLGESRLGGLRVTVTWPRHAAS